jgi:GNAT superfamily N-acetyltransferase
MEIAPMTVRDLAAVLDWAAAEGWNPGLDDAAAFHAADPGGFLIGRVDGEAVAAISVVRHDPAFAFLGLYLCRPDRRGRGHGWALWQAGLALAGDRAVGLDGVAAQQENYRRSGFVPAGRTIRFSGALTGDPAASCLPCAGPSAPVARLDRAAVGYARPAFLAAWLRDAPTRRSLCLCEDGDLLGFGTVRQCREGVKIGPLTATSPEAALRLLRGLAGLFPPGPIFWDVPDGNAPALALASRLGFVPVFETARMYRGDPPRGQDTLAWGVATLELG